MTRRAIAFAAVATLLACSPRANAPKGPLPSLHVTPLADLVPAASVAWVVEIAPREVLAHLDLAPAIEMVLPHPLLDAFARRNGIDPRKMDEIVAAGFPETTLLLARGALARGAPEKAFVTRAEIVDGRAIDRRGASPHDAIARTWGTSDGKREQIAFLGDDAIAVEVGRFGPLRASEAFAEERLKRASPALRSSPLARASELAGDAPIRVFYAGPFEGESARGLGGLMAGATAVAIAVRVLDPPKDAAGEAVDGAFACTVTIVGAWNADAEAAAARLTSAFNVIAESALGKLAHLNHPRSEPRVHATKDAITLEVTLDALAVARGIRAATGPRIDEVMAY